MTTALRRIWTGGLALLLMTASAAAQAPSAPAKGEFSPAQRQVLEKLIGEYLHDHPEAVVDALRVYQERQQAAEEAHRRAILASSRDELENDPAAPTIGKPDASVTIVEFFDYRCQYCKRVLGSVRKVFETDKDVRYVFKEFPILTPSSVRAARAALAVWHLAPDKYFDVHTDLMSANGELTDERILRIAARHGVDADRVQHDMASPDIGAALKRNAELAQRLGIQGTPGFVIAGTLVPGAVDLATLRHMIAEARQTGAPPNP